MSKPSLSIFRPNISSDHTEDRRKRELDRIAGTAEPKTVTVAVGKLMPLLIDAAKHQRAWLDDFADDPVCIDADLYEVLLAYRQLRETAA